MQPLPASDVTVFLPSCPPGHIFIITSAKKSLLSAHISFAVCSSNMHTHSPRLWCSAYITGLFICKRYRHYREFHMGITAVGVIKIHQRLVLLRVKCHLFISQKNAGAVNQCQCQCGRRQSRVLAELSWASPLTLGLDLPSLERWHSADAGMQGPVERGCWLQHGVTHAGGSWFAPSWALPAHGNGTQHSTSHSPARELLSYGT